MVMRCQLSTVTCSISIPDMLELKIMTLYVVMVTGYKCIMHQGKNEIVKNFHERLPKLGDQRVSLYVMFTHCSAAGYNRSRFTSYDSHLP